MAMPWKRAKQIAAALRGMGEFPEKYHGSRTMEELNRLFAACFRIQREASDTCQCCGHGRHDHDVWYGCNQCGCKTPLYREVPLIVENVKGAQPWVGRAKYRYGSFFLWGDVPALMPSTRAGMKCNPDGQGGNGGDFGWDNTPMRRGNSHSASRKAASAQIAKIPFPLAQHIARVFKAELPQKIAETGL